MLPIEIRAPPGVPQLGWLAQLDSKANLWSRGVRPWTRRRWEVRRLPHTRHRLTGERDNKPAALTLDTRGFGGLPDPPQPDGSLSLCKSISARSCNRDC